MRETPLRVKRPSAPKFRPAYHIAIIEKAYGAECGTAKSTQMNSMGQFRPSTFGFGRRLHTDFTTAGAREELRRMPFRLFSAFPALCVEVRKPQLGVMLAFADIATLKIIRKT